MCSPASALTVDLPRRLLADRVTAGLVLVVAIVLEVVGAGERALPAGSGLVLAGGLALWHRHGLRRRPRSLQLGPDGLVLIFADGCCVRATPGPGARRLGRSLVLDWRGPAGRGSVWLTPADVRPEALHALAVAAR